MEAISLAQLHCFYRQVSESVSHACMLGGAVEATPLNQWVIMGLGLRQEIMLRENTLRVNGVLYPLSGANIPEILFEHLEVVRKNTQVWDVQTHQWRLPMAGGLMGCLSYEFYRWCDSGWQALERKVSETDWPELILCEFEDWIFIHLETGQFHVLSNNAMRTAQYQQQWQSTVQPDGAVLPSDLIPLSAEVLSDYIETFEVSLTQWDFEAKVAALKEDIRNGEIYQANLSIRLQKQIALDPYQLFYRLCRKNPSPFSGFFKWPGGIVVCNSPERLVQMNETGVAQTRPIAGTRGRGKTPEEDVQIGETLLNNEKERAEHLMLVDLARNDLGRVCEAGSVRVDDLLMLERYSHVTHLVSNVVGQLGADCNGWDLIRSLFPGGTITGCPKIRCVDILNAVEPVSRGFYTGSMGYFDAASPALDFNILIRSVFLRPLEGHSHALPLVYNTAVHIGAGIVHDAVGTHEYRECLRKATAILQELYTLESPTQRPVTEFKEPNPI
jgi:anthranilate/para-aminobenzoate synthase component I